MANLLSKIEGDISKQVDNLTRDGSSVLTSPYVNKSWIALIEVNRKTSTKKKVQDNNYDPANVRNSNQPNPKEQDLNKISSGKNTQTWYEDSSIKGESKYTGDDPFKWNQNTHSQAKVKQNQIKLFNLITGAKLVIQNRPESVSIEPDTTWATIKGIGRNNPYYVYNGSEDTISFEISWFCNDEKHRDEVLLKCRLLESWTKANGYKNSPPIIAIKWGTSGIFDNYNFILTGASYTLNNFQNAYENGDGKIVDLGLLPQAATQKLTFKRISSRNLLWEDYISSKVLRNINGIELK